MSTPPLGYPELMVDIETLGGSPKAAVLAIGAVPFCLHESKLEVAPKEAWFDARITLQANIDAGRGTDPETIEWWLGQSREAQEALLREPRYTELDTLRSDFAEYVARHRCAHVWAKPPMFDVLILRDLFGRAWPFDRKSDRDLRTVLALAKAMGWTDVLEPPALDGAKHDAVYDAHVQTVQVLAVFRKIRKFNPVPIHGSIVVKHED